MNKTKTNQANKNQTPPFAPARQNEAAPPVEPPVITPPAAEQTAAAESLSSAGKGESANSQTEASPSGENVKENEAPEKAPENETSTDPDEPVIKSNFRKIRVADLRGSYKDTHFNDDCEALMSKETFEHLQAEYPEATIEFLD